MGEIQNVDIGTIRKVTLVISATENNRNQLVLQRVGQLLGVVVLADFVFERQVELVLPFELFEAVLPDVPVYVRHFARVTAAFAVDIYVNVLLQLSDVDIAFGSRFAIARHPNNASALLGEGYPRSVRLGHDVIGKTNELEIWQGDFAFLAITYRHVDCVTVQRVAFFYLLRGLSAEVYVQLTRVAVFGEVGLLASVEQQYVRFSYTRPVARRLTVVERASSERLLALPPIPIIDPQLRCPV